MRSKSVKIGAGIAITVVALYFFLKGVDGHAVAESFKRVNPITAALVVVLVIFSLFLRGARWGLLLPDEPGASKKGLFPLATVAFMINSVLPARIGEAARVYFLCKNNRYSVHASLGSVAFERVLDSLLYGIFLMFPIFFVDLAEKKFFGTVDVIVPAHIAAAGVAGIIGAILFYRFFPNLFVRIGGAIALRSPALLAKGIRHGLKLMSSATAWLFDLKKVAGVAVLSPLIVLCYGLCLWLLANMLGISLGPLQATFVMSVVAFGVAVPSSPGYIGPLHLACKEGLVLFGANPADAVTVAILYHLLSWTPVVVTGIFFYFRMNLSIREVKKEGSEAQRAKESRASS
ncbi:MAG: hypothetical protein A2268_01705 [Candidatus Raymondbacteria bacterium RifOxyA12_full_50_37]|uniref:TIGR00374 family protein n=1 Tax=Candidatus Raymondbacteria bacterium RIFOXYD12_FULL_49_13 TaxID=1817890 RepID=A0A1F7F9T9_UNCRA|nr:MAG: hypothetical protein A2268_01705 [Candidatus Raymondbacteria bacterium RifOxyA12_full_50_37]OGJ87781.1 MAG: hypothetical protein A2248_07310 [Candidatus Raymondbacteria bacterium RIFOXYA2_FULL_49_16]OGJ92488.1 MAG: hypothetical protein A2350_02970 [Candidatus Raymondbacteria bacterium RifOxyB12_full_50_8]OGJ95458.1 MAG: hypothetical protein A2487_15755 [Candidatus Raymondbacteria bacterium RifOxyC12_full_50_8]OGJ95659.1 MAG: hypothetical protein A2453_13305 [Candidatus Raymondbacteria b